MLGDSRIHKQQKEVGRLRGRHGVCSLGSFFKGTCVMPESAPEVSSRSQRKQGSPLLRVCLVARGEIEDPCCCLCGPPPATEEKKPCWSTVQPRWCLDCRLE